MIEPAYRYRASVVRVIDGDTYIMLVDLGFRTSVELPIRLQGYDTPERNEPGWAAATEFASSALLNAQTVVIESYKGQRTFDRWVADVYVDGESLGIQLHAAGYA